MDDPSQDYLFESTAEPIYFTTEATLAGKIRYDDAAVFRRLRVGDVEEDFIIKCVVSLRSQMTKEINLLERLAQKAFKMSSDDLERQEKNNKANDPNRKERSGNHGSTQERKMYEPLIRIFDHIANFKQDSCPRRLFLKTDSLLKPTEPHTFGSSSVSPDITISPRGVDASKSKKWRDRDAFGEVKPSKKQGPRPGTETIPTIVTRSADYARLFLSGRPFMLYCIGILIFGTEFCIGIFDRDGITLSPIHDMFQDIEIFVRVVYSLACNLSIEELGHDPSVRGLTDQETETLTGAKQYPSYVASPIGMDERQWCTIGSPIWVSFSLLGRGTQVWFVREYMEGDNQQPYLQGNRMIMKTSWRNSSRTPESDIYLSIEEPIPKGVAKFECGADVVQFCGPARYPITVQNLRNADSDKLWVRELDNPTHVLHRLIISTIGRPMWGYESDYDLLTGYRDAIEAHKALCEKGILHRDISAGNVLLTEAEDSDSCGFITDLEFAQIEKYIPSGVTASVTREGIEQDGILTGTVQFMASALLRGTDRAGNRVVHEAKHDVESFIWVLSYSVMRNLCMKASYSDTAVIRELGKELAMRFHQAFGQTREPDWIAFERQSESAAVGFSFMFGLNELTNKYMSGALISLFRDIMRFIHFRSDACAHPLILTHDLLLEKVNGAIAALLSSE